MRNVTGENLAEVRACFAELGPVVDVPTAAQLMTAQGRPVSTQRVHQLASEGKAPAIRLLGKVFLQLEWILDPRCLFNDAIADRLVKSRGCDSASSQEAKP
jgi:hypothetical protein